MDDHNPVDINAISREHRERLPVIVSQIESLIRTTDQIELLSHLTMLYQTHSVAGNDRNENARWQAKIEWLAWLSLSRHMSAPDMPVVIDATFLGALEPLIDEYFTAVALSL